VIDGARWAGLDADHIDRGPGFNHRLARLGELSLLGSLGREQDRDLTAAQGLISHDESFR
jgi:hypothetical protein